MKTNYLLLSVFSLFLLFGCSSGDGEVVPPVPEEEIPEEPLPPQCESYEGAIIEISPTFLIEYFDKESIGFRLLIFGDGYDQEFLDYASEYMTVEYISFIDEITGQVFTPYSGYKEGAIDSVRRFDFGFSADRFRLESPETTRNYVIKYKVPSFKGESIEEIKGIYHHKGGIKGVFTEVLYNGEQIPILDIEEIGKPFTTETGGIIDHEGYNNMIKETHYNGKPVAIRAQGTEVYIVLPYEKP